MMAFENKGNCLCGGSAAWWSLLMPSKTLIRSTWTSLSSTTTSARLTTLTWKVTISLVFNYGHHFVEKHWTFERFFLSISIQRSIDFYQVINWWVKAPSRVMFRLWRRAAGASNWTCGTGLTVNRSFTMVTPSPRRSWPGMSSATAFYPTPLNSRPIRLFSP